FRPFSRPRERSLRQRRQQRIPPEQRARFGGGGASRGRQAPGGVDLEAQPIVRPPRIAARQSAAHRSGVFLGEKRRQGGVHPPERQTGALLPGGERAGLSLAALQLERGVGDPGERAEQNRQRRGESRKQGGARSHASRYPRPRTVSSTRGSPVPSASPEPAPSRSFLRRRATVISTVRVSIRRGSISQTRTNTSSRGTSRPSAAVRYESRRASRSDSSSREPSSKRISLRPKSIAPPGIARISGASARAGERRRSASIRV